MLSLQNDSPPCQVTWLGEGGQGASVQHPSPCRALRRLLPIRHTMRLIAGFHFGLHAEISG